MNQQIISDIEKGFVNWYSRISPIRGTRRERLKQLKRSLRDTKRDMELTRDLALLLVAIGEEAEKGPIMFFNPTDIKAARRLQTCFKSALRIPWGDSWRISFFQKMTIDEAREVSLTLDFLGEGDCEESHPIGPGNAVTLRNTAECCGTLRNAAEHCGMLRNAAEHAGTLQNGPEHAGTVGDMLEQAGTSQNIPEPAGTLRNSLEQDGPLPSGPEWEGFTDFDWLVSELELDINRS